MDNNHDRTKEVLNNIDQEADAIKMTVYNSQDELRQTLEEIIEECDISRNKKEQDYSSKEEMNKPEE